MVEINKLEQVEKEDFLPLEPKPEHIDYLLANPSTASQFDAKYGEGASLRYLPTQIQEENKESGTLNPLCQLLHTLPCFGT